MAEVRIDPHDRGVGSDSPFPPVTHDEPRRASGNRLVGVGELGERGVVEVQTADQGVLAVGISGGRAFAVSNLCRHQLARLGRGRVTPDGCLECPWHRARYDVEDGTMLSGPKGRIFGFKPYSHAIKVVANRLRLGTHAVEVRDDAVWLLDRGAGPRGQAVRPHLRPARADSAILVGISKGPGTPSTPCADATRPLPRSRTSRPPRQPVNARAEGHRQPWNVPIRSCDGSSSRRRTAAGRSLTRGREPLCTGPWWAVFPFRLFDDRSHLP